ncbi:MAG: JAB domain-containing protein [Pseudomonadota bacterium]
MENTNCPVNTTFIREVAVRYTGPPRRAESIRSPHTAAALMRRIVQDDAREHFVAIYLDGRHHPVAHQVVSIGTATASLVHPREVFQPAVLVGATAIIVGHNHPSGDPSPSQEDREVTRRLSRAGEVLGIRLVDHVVWTRDSRIFSFHEADELA